jgi:hypothetical protein
VLRECSAPGALAEIDYDRWGYGWIPGQGAGSWWATDKPIPLATTTGITPGHMLPTDTSSTLLRLRRAAYGTGMYSTGGADRGAADTGA